MDFPAVGYWDMRSWLVSIWKAVTRSPTCFCQKKMNSRNNSPLSTPRSEIRINTGGAASGEFAQLSTNSPLSLHDSSKNTARCYEISSTLQPLAPVRSKFWRSTLKISAKRAGFFAKARWISGCSFFEFPEKNKWTSHPNIGVWNPCADAGFRMLG